ncbi:hypothetical protein ACFM35_12935 [Microbacterium sp. P01]|uniref:hypothetical protein n=1 Tax=Microbacterium sp. P01 TaxID=3366261 RepID=UPI00366FB5B5
MDHGAGVTLRGDAEQTPDASATAGAASARRSSLAVDLTLLAIVGVLLVAAIGAGALSLYRQLYSPTAFVERYLTLLSEGRAADALTLPGVAIESAALRAAGMPEVSSEALLRRDALASLTDIQAVSETADGGLTRVTMSYRAGDYAGSTTFDVTSDGWIGITPRWRFATSPLAVIDLTVRGSMSFSVNGFTIDKRQISPDLADADPLAAVPLLVFSPGLYSVTVDTPVATAAGTAVVSDSPLVSIPVDLQAQPTAQFVAVVEEQVQNFLTGCATQQVLQPTACPFGYPVQDRIVSPPTWSIVTQPTVTVTPDGADWKIERTEAVAHIDVDIRSLYDGRITRVSEDVPFALRGSIDILADGTASISVTSTDER